MSDLKDRTSAILKSLEQLDLDGDEVPDFIENQDGNQPEDEKKKAARAWHGLRTQLKDAKNVIEEFSKEHTQGVQTPAPQPEMQPNQSPDPNLQLQQQFYMSQLQTRAMTNTKIADPNHPMVRMETQRLYNEDMAMAQRQITAATDAEKVFDSTITEFEQLDDEDKTAIKERMATIPALERTDPERVKQFVHMYMGEHFQKFAGKASGASGQPASKSSAQGGSAPAAAASSVKSRGGVGVGEGAPGSGQSGGGEKPATEEELRKMRELHIPPDRVDLYRKAVRKKSKYVPR